ILFGNNNYDLPVYHPLMEEDRVVVQGADTVYYRVEGSLGADRSGLAYGSAMLEDRINLICFLDSGNRSDRQNLKNELKRLETVFRGENRVQGIVVTAQTERTSGWEKE